MPRALSHQSGHRLELVSLKFVMVNGKKSPMDRELIQFLNALVAESPGCVEHSEIRLLLLNNGISETGVHRLVSDLTAWFKAEKLPKIYQSKRSTGYRLHPEWTIDRLGDPMIDEALVEIRQICDETREHVRLMAWEETPSGLQYVAAGDGVPQRLFNRLHVASWKLMTALAVLPTASAALIIRLKNALFEIVSYVTFWRLGTRYDEEEWKDEFDQELKASLEVVEILVTRIMRI